MTGARVGEAAVHGSPDGLDEALRTAIDRYRAANPTSERHYQAAADDLPGGNTRSVLYYPPFPLYMIAGEGCYLTDVDGHRYLDALGEFTAGIYGHSHLVIRAAITEALASGLNLSAHGPREAALAAELCRRFGSLELVRFTNSGTEANLMALATAVAHTGRDHVLVFTGAYHGGVLSFAHGPSPVTVPHRWIVARYNDPADVRARTRDHRDQLAAILVEPMLGAGGCVPGDPEFLAGLRALATESGAVLIFDEVMTSRLSLGGRQAMLGLRPDLTTLGKYLGGGLSFGAFGGRAELMAHYDPRSPGAYPHAGTFNNNVLSMAAGLAGLREALSAEALDELNDRGERLRRELNAIFAGAGVAAQYTGLGSLLQLHGAAGPIRHADDLARCDPRAEELIFFGLLARGVYTARRGFIALSLPFDAAATGRLRDALADVVAEYRDVLPPRG